MTMTAVPRVLVADDQPDVLEAMRLLLKSEGYEAKTAGSPSEVMDALDKREFDAVLIDLNYARDTTSGAEGIELLARLIRADETLPVIVMTAWATIDLAVEAMRLGARDFVQKPWDNTRLLATLRTQIDLRRAIKRGERLEAENLALREAAQGDLVASSAVMRPVIEMIERIGPSDANVLVTGENGTGKGTVTQRLHAVSARADKPFVVVNVGGLSESVFESELFGHVKGAFTDAKTDRIGRFETADGGTLFLDEIANLSLNLQAKLLRVVETGEFEPVGSSRTRRAGVRLLSATNADVASEVAAGRFRQDLLFRLNTIEIHIPPLRERREDVMPLAERFLARHKERYRKRLLDFDPEARASLMRHAFPGNIRELDHAVERGVLMSKGETIRAADLALRSAGEPRDRLEEMSIEEVEQLLIRKALARNDGNVSRAADALGLSRSALYRRLQKHGM
ncbi:MAG: sigma-54-dependent Fis family transcriptional regulator [Vicinamibacteria bacterium]|nr:sigma-54-dependent Fis family transcriptional regulator [Vicinamibacteria bacterium]